MSDHLHSNEKAAAFMKETRGGANSCTNSCRYFGGKASAAVARRATGGLEFRGSSRFVRNEI